jgi:prepilin-type N-terminal cleavage/methylation domain-containing protein
MKRNGFSLIELLVVIGIIGFLVSGTIVALGPVRAKARDTKRKTELGQIGRFLSATNCYTPNSGPGDYDLADLFNEVKAKFPQVSVVSLPKDPKTGSNTRTNYHYAYSDENKCILYVNLENEKEPTTLNVSSPTPGFGTGVLRSNTTGVNGSQIYYQVGK